MTVGIMIRFSFYRMSLMQVLRSYPGGGEVVGVAVWKEPGVLVFVVERTKWKNGMVCMIPCRFKLTFY